MFSSYLLDGLPVVVVEVDNNVVRHLLIWLDLPTVREQRRYLEAYNDILSLQSDTILYDLIMQEIELPKKVQQFRNALFLLQDARERGGTKKAIREAYINTYGGLSLDLPPWLEVVEQQLADLLGRRQHRPLTEADVVLFFDALTKAQADTDVVPETLAALRHELAVAWQTDVSPNRTQALENAIKECEEVLRVYTLARYPRQYASTQRSLGAAYYSRLEGQRRENLEQAIACYRETLRMYTLGRFPAEYAETQSDLGNIFWRRIAGERRENVEQAIACYREAVRVFTFEAFPAEYAETQSGLGLAYWNRIAGERRENMERAIGCYLEAVRVFTFEAFPYRYALAQDNLGRVYKERIAGERRENIERAIACYQEALRVCAMKTFPEEYARTQNRLGNAYRERIAGERRENIERAIACYQEALLVRTFEAFPYKYAVTQNNLGLAYWQRVAGERRENIERAITCYQQALRVHTFEAFPLDHLLAQYNLGLAYQDRVEGERRENIKRSIACYQQALLGSLKMYPPYGYARAQHKLGTAYRDYDEGERGENLKQAIAYFHQALSAYPLEVFPFDHRLVQLSIAEAEAQRGNWIAVHDAYTAALDAEDLLVALGAGTTGRDAILKEGHDAAIRDGYALTHLGRVEEAAMTIERGRARGLAEAMAFDAADPSLIRNTQLRTRYTVARQTFIAAQAALHTPQPPTLDEDALRHLELTQMAAYRSAKAAFDAMVSEIRAAHDPADFLNGPLDASLILRAIERAGPGHALVYLAATPWGGIALAAFGVYLNRRSQVRFAVLDLPDLTDAMMAELIDVRLHDSTECIIGGFSLAQVGGGFDQILQDWSGETFQARVRALHTACRRNRQESTLDISARAALALRPFSRLAKRPLVSLSRTERSLLNATFGQIFLQQELQRSLNTLGQIALHPLSVWLHEQGVSSLTLIPCSYLAAYPLAAVVLPGGRSLGEMFSTSVAPNARSFLHSEVKHISRMGVYALGDPHEDLPWSEAEALTLTALAHQHTLPAEAQVKRKATRDWLLTTLQTGYIVDASCHGTFDPRDFLRSALRLAGGERLTMAEMLGHYADLHGLRLLILSACQTAILDLHGARDEFHSLAAAMLQAGADAVLAALWAVDDLATYLLMIRFAQEWFPKVGCEPPSAALARAQYWLRTVTNAELRSWEREIPKAPEAMRLTAELQSLTSRYQPRRTRTERVATTSRLMPIRGQNYRFDEHEAQIVVRIRAEWGDDSTCPYADPYYWAGFQIIGW
jgi:CHAT domain-containing protein/tetratricopeptide (TPR) repeat protein